MRHFIIYVLLSALLFLIFIAFPWFAGMLICFTLALAMYESYWITKQGIMKQAYSNFTPFQFVGSLILLATTLFLPGLYLGFFAQPVRYQYDFVGLLISGISGGLLGYHIYYFAIRVWGNAPFSWPKTRAIALIAFVSMASGVTVGALVAESPISLKNSFANRPFGVIVSVACLALPASLILGINVIFWRHWVDSFYFTETNRDFQLRKDNLPND